MEPKSENPVSSACSRAREKAALILLLGWIAGFSDAFGWLKLNHIFTSHVSGNSVAAGALVTRGNGGHGLLHAFPILFFAVGSFAGFFLENATRRVGIRHRFSLVLALETGLLLTFILVGQAFAHAQNLPTTEPGIFCLLVALLAGAMGLQAASVRRVRGFSVHTPFITGMLMQSMENAVLLLFQVYDKLTRQLPAKSDESDQNFFLRMIFFGGLWVSFVFGAVCGSLCEQTWNYSAMLLPMVGLVFASVLGFVWRVYE